MVEVNNNNSEWENAMREIMTQDDSLKPSSNVNNVNVPINIDLSDFFRETQTKDNELKKEIFYLQEKLNDCRDTRKPSSNIDQQKDIEKLISEKEEIRKDFERKLKEAQKDNESEKDDLEIEKEEIRKDFERKLESEMEKMGKENSDLEEKLNVCKNISNKEQEKEIENLISEKEQIQKDFERELKSEKDKSKSDLESQKNVFDLKITDLLNKNKDLELSNNLKLKEIETLTTTEIGESEKLDSLQRQIDTGKKIIEENNETIENLKRENQSLEVEKIQISNDLSKCCLLYTSPSPRDGLLSRMPSSA